jgi:hypothetical protein
MKWDVETPQKLQHCTTSTTKHCQFAQGMSLKMNTATKELQNI